MESATCLRYGIDCEAIVWNHHEVMDGINPKDWIKKNEAIASFFFCQEATKKIFFPFCNKVSNSHGSNRQKQML